MIPGRRQHWSKGSSKHQKKPRTTFQKQTSRLDGYFSMWLRLSSMDANGLCRCFTCGALKTWNNRKTHAGHFIPRSANRFFRVRWDVKNVKCQCTGCNSNQEGKQYIFGIKLDNLYGVGTAEALQIKSTQFFNKTIFDMELHISEYREKVNFLKKRHGIK